MILIISLSVETETGGMKTMDPRVVWIPEIF